MSDNKPDKGLEGGSCNRTACQAPDAVWYNHSTQKWYCESCALKLNAVNHKDAQELYGFELCTCPDLYTEKVEGSLSHAHVLVLQAVKDLPFEKVKEIIEDDDCSEPYNALLYVVCEEIAKGNGWFLDEMRKSNIYINYAIQAIVKEKYQNEHCLYKSTTP